VILGNIKKLLQLTYERSWEVNIGLHGAAIAFFTIFSIAPLIIILLWIVSLFLGTQLGQTELNQTLTSILGPQLSQSVQALVDSTAKSQTGFWSSVLTIITLLFGATTLLSQLKQTLNLIWGISDPKIHTVWQYLWDRFVGLLFIGLLSILFLAGLLAESVLYGMGSLLSPVLGNHNILIYKYTTSVLNVVFTFVFFASMFRILSDIRVRFRDITVGAAFTTFLIIIGKILIGWYLTASSLQPAYQAAGSFVLFLVWVYYNVQVVLFGAVFTSVYTRLHGGDIQPYWGATVNDWHSDGD